MPRHARIFIELSQHRVARRHSAVALNPHTPVSVVDHVLDLVDLVLVMTVNPGFGGQSYIASMEHKVSELRDLIGRRGLSTQVNIEVDGESGPPRSPARPPLAPTFSSPARLCFATPRARTCGQ